MSQSVYHIPRIIAVGGGGFTHACDPTLEDFILGHVSNHRPRIGYVGTANYDDPEKIALFHQRFGLLCSVHTHLSPQATVADVGAWVAPLDIVYVGGGNTLHLIETWRRTGIDAVMVTAARQGVLMAGVSAGANVWFEHALSDSGGHGLAPIDGIGLVAGSCCPHYSTEPLRQPAYLDCIATGSLPGGIAIDDGAAVLLDGTGLATVYSARKGAGAYRITRNGAGMAVSIPL